jgi:hypothetical protein
MRYVDLAGSGRREQAFVHSAQGFPQRRITGEATMAFVSRSTLGVFGALLSGTLITWCGPAAAHTPGSKTDLGDVHFKTSCNAEAQAKFDLGMSYQHSFWYRAATDTFNEVLKLDPGCAIAYWGLALATMRNPYVPPSAAWLAEGLAAIEKGLALGPKSDREKGYLEALAAFYRNHDKVPHGARQIAYAKAMEALAARYPDDTEAQIYWALALAVTTPPTDKTYANALKAAKTLEPIFEAQPRHPGVAHYIIHAYDYPPIAKQGLEAAKRYAAIAPDAPHALHMPSHIFTRVGYWQDSIESNAASARIAKERKEGHDEAHALDYLVYAFLQTAQDTMAAKAVAELGRVEGITSNFFVGPFAQAAAPARYALERSQWTEAATLTVLEQPYPQNKAQMHFARAVGAGRTGKAEAARAEAATLAALAEQLMAAKNAYWAEQVDIQRRTALAWAAWADKRHDEAMAAMADAADREDLTEKHPVTPGPLLPAREMLAEMLLEHGKAKEAQAAFEAVLAKEPHRFRATFGAARAAEAAGDAATAKLHYQALLVIAKEADTERPELKLARAFVAR